ILAGEEFADDHDRAVVHPAKQSDPVNFSRATDDWRAKVLEYVSRLVKFRTANDALSVNDTEFLHADFTPGRRVVAWRRGRSGVDAPVVVVANFSDYDSAAEGHAEYRVPNWPDKPVGKKWRDVSQGRDVPDEWA